MEVFISWSGERSRHVATALREWLPELIQVLQPWMSSTEIGSGQPWHSEIMRALAKAKFGIICVTPENMVSPWLIFEAGACAKALDGSSAAVCPYLFGLRESELTGPLSAYQARRADKDSTMDLVRDINRALGEQARPAEQLERSFEKWWQDLENKLTAVSEPTHSPSPKRSTDDILEEILSIVRSSAATTAKSLIAYSRPFAEKEPFRVGELVSHKVFGEGVVSRVDGKTVLASFPVYGDKTVVESFLYRP